MAAEWLRAEWLAEVASRHYEFEAKYCDDDGNIVLRERRCAHCDEDWPCDAGVLLAQDGRWRALVGSLTPVLEAAEVFMTASFAGTPGQDYMRARRALNVACEQARMAQAALDGATEEGRDG